MTPNFLHQHRNIQRSRRVPQSLRLTLSIRHYYHLSRIKANLQIPLHSHQLAMSPAALRNNRVWSRREIEGVIADGRKIIILDGQALKADTWLPYHPGGDKSVLHMVGRDATDEITALHSEEAQVHMQRYVIGRVHGTWENFLPPIQGGAFRPLVPKHDDDEALYAEDDVASSGKSTHPHHRSSIMKSQVMRFV